MKYNFQPVFLILGASSDFSTATRIATAMVKQFGMSEKVGVRMFDNEAFDSGLSMLKVNDVSPATTDLVDSEIKRLLQVSPPAEFCSFMIIPGLPVALYYPIFFNLPYIFRPIFSSICPMSPIFSEISSD